MIDALRRLNPLPLLTMMQAKSVFRAICAEHDLVYFGHVNQYDDEHELVKGVTFSHNHRDNHYVVGTVNGYDLILLERTDTISFPGKPTEAYTWIILQVDLHESLHLPHVFIDAKHHESGFYNALFAKFSRLSPAEHAFDEQQYEKLFLQRFHCYTPPDAIDTLPLLLTRETAAVMAHHFGHFDVEWIGDRLMIYSTGRPATKHLIDTMLREGIWLAAEIEKRAHRLHNNHQ